MKTPGIVSLCKARGQLLSAGPQLNSFGKPVVYKDFTCLDYNEELSVLFAGGREGALHIFKF